jgi:hypothetical protein
MATIIVTPKIVGQIPNLVTFDPITRISNQQCSIDIQFSLIAGVTVDVAIGVQIINLNNYRFDNDQFLMSDEADNVQDGDQKTIHFRLKQNHAVPPGGMPNCFIRVITWDKTSNNHADKRVTSTSFNV